MSGPFATSHSSSAPTLPLYRWLLSRIGLSGIRAAAICALMIASSGTWSSLVSFAAAAPASAAIQPAEPLVILALGDSITKGVRGGVTNEQTFCFLLEAALKKTHPTSTVINAGIGGEKTDGALRRIVDLLSQHRPRFVTLMYGTNDCHIDQGQKQSRLSPQQFRANLRRLVQLVREAGSDPILMTEPRYAAVSPANGLGEHGNVRLEPYVQVTREVARELGTPLMDHFAGWTAAEKGSDQQPAIDLKDWTTDGYHPNPAGHADIARRMEQSFEQLISTRAFWPWKDAVRSSAGLQRSDAITVAGATVYTQPGSLIMHFAAAPTQPQIVLPRLNNVVLRAWWQPLSTEPNSAAAVSPGATDIAAAAPASGSEYGLPFVPSPQRLLAFSQSPQEWTIKLPAGMTYPALVLLDVVDLPALPSAEPIEAAADGSLVLPAHRARVQGEKLQFEPLTHKNTVGYWVNPKDWAGWSLLTPPAAAPIFSGKQDPLPVLQTWDVEILQGCGGGQGGSLVELSFVAAGAEPRKVSFTVEETGHFQNFRWRSIGSVQLPAGTKLDAELRCAKLAHFAVMDMRQVRLVPHRDLPPDSTASSQSGAPGAFWQTPTDIFPPPLTREPPGPGRRSLIVGPIGSRTGSAAPASTDAEFESGQKRPYCTLTLPTDWTAGKKYPLLVEFTGNGPYANPQGDRCTGRVESASLAAGIASNDGYILLSLPYLNAAGTANVTQWWGTPPAYDSTATRHYARTSIETVCKEYGGDPERVVWVGFSRGALAANVIGLADDQTAGLWRAFICFSHYDGVRSWPYPHSDAAAAKERLLRLKDRPQLLLTESAPVAGASSEELKKYLAGTGIAAKISLAETGFVNHDDRWVLRPSAARQQLREWLSQVLK